MLQQFKKNIFLDYNGTVSMSSDPGNCTTLCCGNCNTITANGNNLEGRNCSSNSNTIVGRCGNTFLISKTSIIKAYLFSLLTLC